MKNFQSILLYLVAAAVAILFVLHFSGKGGENNSRTKAVSKDSNAVAPQQLRVAYIDLDTLQQYYEYFKLKNGEIEKEKQRIEEEIQRGLEKLERDRVDFLKKGNSITQVEAENFQRDYQNRYQQLQTRQQTLQNQHLGNQDKAIEDIKKRINEYLKEYNKTGKYSFIFSTQEANPTLYYKDTLFDITRDVIKGLNETYQQTKKK
jgi:outer membrane protein